MLEVGCGGERGGIHAGEQVLGPRWGPAGGGVGDTAAPLEDKGQGSEGEREHGEEEEKPRGERVGRGWLVGAEQGLEVLVVRHVERQRELEAVV